MGHTFSQLGLVSSTHVTFQNFHNGLENLKFLIVKYRDMFFYHYMELTAW